VNRLLRGVVIEGDREPVAGAEVQAGEKVVGRVTTVVRSPRFGIAALALLRREVEPGAALTVTIDDGPVAADARELPFT
jgi:glycine cleavage system aminomethyltransferase T